MIDKEVLKKKFEEGNYEYDEKLFEEIKKTLQDRYEKEGYVIDDIIKRFPDNTNLTEVYAKVVIVNTTHSAGVDEIHCIEVAEDIVEFDNFDERLKNGDIKLVDELIEKTHKKIGKFQWAFYPKYLACHNPIMFSKYDRYVGKHVNKRSEALGLHQFKTKVGEFYENYYNAITEIIKKDKDDFPDRQTFDTFIWALYRKDGKNE